MNTLNNYGPAAIIVLGYVIGLYFQNKRLDDFREALYRYLDAKFETVNIRFGDIGDRLDKIEKNQERLVK